jgi:Zn-dependent protease
MCLRHHTHPRPNRPMFREWESYGYEAPRRTGFHTSGTEILHLVVALIVLTTAFTFFFGGVTPGTQRRETMFGLHNDPLLDVAIMSFVALGTGFILHELMHKLVAQIYGHWAEFRAQTFGLLIPVPLALFTGFIFAAPGAVVIAGYVQRHQNGIISAAGPLTNIVIGYIALPFTLIPGASGTFAFKLAMMVAAVNAILALFNMLPIFVLDGRKVWRWNKAVFAGIWAIGILLIVLVFAGI